MLWRAKVYRGLKGLKHRQWDVGLTRAGFSQLPLDQKLMKKAGAKLGGCYHKDFMLNEESNWLLLGWRRCKIPGGACWVSHVASFLEVKGQGGAGATDKDSNPL